MKKRQVITIRTTITASCDEHGDFATVDAPDDREGSDEDYLEKMSALLKKHNEEFHQEGGS